MQEKASYTAIIELAEDYVFRLRFPDFNLVAQSRPGEDLAALAQRTLQDHVNTLASVPTPLSREFIKRAAGPESFGLLNVTVTVPRTDNVVNLFKPRR